MFQFKFDPGKGVLSVKVVGSWTMPEVERYGREARGQFAQARKAAGRLRLLIDLSDAEILSQSVIEPLARAGMQYSQPDDLVVIVVGSTLLKLQMKRMIGDAPIPILLSVGEAAACLRTAEDAAPRSAA